MTECPVAVLYELENLVPGLVWVSLWKGLLQAFTWTSLHSFTNDLAAMIFLQCTACVPIWREWLTSHSFMQAFTWNGFEDGTTWMGGLWAGLSTQQGDFATITYRAQLYGFNAVRIPFRYVLKLDLTANLG